MTPDDFMGAALDNPGTIAQGLGAGLMDTFTTSTSIGMGIRAITTPRKAIVSEDPNDVDLSQIGGRRPTYRPETEEEVTARGDVLLDTEEKQRLSPYHRDAIPHEAGMTESRLKAMAEDYDLSQVRRHYMEKRPISAFVGGLIGTVADPINFIPILGPAAKAVAVGKLGRVAGTAAIGAAEATISTAVFDALALKERARVGDPMDFDMFAMDLAFSALAGSLIGGTIGAFTRKGSSVSPEAIAEAMTAAERIKATAVMNDAIDSMISYGEVRLSPQSQEFSAQVGRKIEMADSGVTARQLGVTRVAIGADGGRMTPEDFPAYASAISPEVGAKYKVAEAALEKSLGPEGAEFVSMAREIVTLKALIDTKQLDDKTPEQAKKELADLTNELVANLDEDGLKAFEAYAAEAKSIRPDAITRVKQIKELTETMSDDMEGLAEIQTKMFKKTGFKNLDDRQIDELHARIIGGKRPPSSRLPSIASEAKAVLGKDAWTGRTNYSGATVSPTEVTFKTEVRQAEAAVSKLPKVADTNKLEIEDAKQDGIDIETGKHDLEDEVKAIVETLSDAEKKAFQDMLDEADNEFIRATTLGDVLTFASQCFIR